MRRIEELKAILPDIYDDIELVFHTYSKIRYDYLMIMSKAWEDVIVRIAEKLIQEGVEPSLFLCEISFRLNQAIRKQIRFELKNRKFRLFNNLLIKLNHQYKNKKRLLGSFVYEFEHLDISFMDEVYDALKENLSSFNALLELLDVSDLSKGEFINYLNKEYSMGIKMLGNNNTPDYSLISEKYSNMSFEQIRDLFGDDFYELSYNSVNLLERYFGVSNSKHCNMYGALKEINLMLFGYKKKNTSLSLDLLKEVYLAKKEEFSLEQQMYLESYVFSILEKEEFFKQFPNSKVYRKHKELINKLERLYFGVDELFSYTLTKEQYLKVRTQLPNIDMTLLDLYYGVNGKALSIQQLCESYDISSEEMRSRIFEIRKKCVSLLYNLSEGIKVDRNVYSPYITNKRYELNDEARDILKLFVIDGMSYEDIAEERNKTTRDIAAIVSRGLQKIDTYRFGIDKPIKYTKQDLDEYFNSKKCEALIENIIRLKYLDFLANDEIADLLSLELARVNRIVGDFNHNYTQNELKNVQLDMLEIEEEINRHITDSVLSELEKTIISYYYGIKSKYNFEGQKLTSKDIKTNLGISGDVSKKVSSILDKIKRRKIGDLSPEFIYISREKLANLINDPHLPISSEDRDIICYLLELNDYPLKTSKDLTEIFGVNEKGIKRKYQMAIINISKYLLGEKEGVISYEEDILPNLQYFTSNERNLIKDYYDLDLSYKEIALKYNVSLDKIKKSMYRIKIQLNNIIAGDTSRMFNFDYYFEVIDKDDLPFYGNKALAKRIFELYAGINSLDKLSLRDIKDQLNLDLKENTILNIIRSLILSILKYRMGIKREKSFTLEDVKAYYSVNKENLSPNELKMFVSFFNKKIGVNLKMSEDLTFLLLKNTYSNLFHFSSLTKSSAKEFLRKHSNVISMNVRNAIISAVGL